MSDNQNFFVHENIFITFIIISGLFVIIPIAGLNPELLAVIFGSNVFQLAAYYQENIWTFFVFCMWIHAFEAVIALILAGFIHKMNLKTSVKWTLSAFVHGYFSIRHLIK